MKNYKDFRGFSKMTFKTMFSNYEKMGLSANIFNCTTWIKPKHSNYMSKILKQEKQTSLNTNILFELLILLDFCIALFIEGLN